MASIFGRTVMRSGRQAGNVVLAQSIRLRLAPEPGLNVHDSDNRAGNHAPVVSVTLSERVAVPSWPCEELAVRRNAAAY